MYAEMVKLVEMAREILRSEGYFVDNLWHVDDVHLICDDKGYPKLSNEEAMEILKTANENFEGEFGVNWPQLERAVASYIVGNKLIAFTNANKFRNVKLTQLEYSI